MLPKCTSLVSRLLQGLFCTLGAPIYSTWTRATNHYYGLRNVQCDFRFPSFTEWCAICIQRWQHRPLFSPPSSPSSIWLLLLQILQQLHIVARAFCQSTVSFLKLHFEYLIWKSFPARESGTSDLTKCNFPTNPSRGTRKFIFGSLM